MPLFWIESTVQRSAKVGALGVVNFVAAVVYHFSLNLAAEFTQPGASTLAYLSSVCSPASFFVGKPA